MELFVVILTLVDELGAETTKLCPTKLMLIIPGFLDVKLYIVPVGQLLQDVLVDVRCNFRLVSFLVV